MENGRGIWRFSARDGTKGGMVSVIGGYAELNFQPGVYAVRVSNAVHSWSKIVGRDNV